MRTSNYLDPFWVQYPVRTFCGLAFPSVGSYISAFSPPPLCRLPHHNTLSQNIRDTYGTGLPEATTDDRKMRRRLPLQQTRIHHWIVNITPSRVDSLPYSKIKSISHKYRQRLLASRTAPVAPRPLPPASIFICQPTPSYVVSPQLAAQLTKSEISSLKSNLRVYEGVLTGETDFGEVCLEFEEQDCTPEFLIDQDLGGDRALYYGHGQIHFIGMIDMHRPEVKGIIPFESAAEQHRRFTEEVLQEPTREFKPSVAKSLEGLESWVVCNTEDGHREVARIVTDAGHSDGIATTSVTLNLTVPVLGVDPDMTCPHARLAAAEIGTGPVTSIWALDGRAASDRRRISGVVGEESMCSSALLWSMQRVMGLEWGQSFVDPSRALGEHDPDLESDEDAERRSLAREESAGEEDHGREY